MEGPPGGRCPAGAAGRAGMGWLRRPPWAAASRGAVAGIVPGVLGFPLGAGVGAGRVEAFGQQVLARRPSAGPGALGGAGCLRAGAGTVSRPVCAVVSQLPPRPGAAAGGSWQLGSRSACCPRTPAQAGSPAWASPLSPSPGRGSPFLSSPGGAVRGSRPGVLLEHPPAPRCPPAQDRKEMTKGPGLSRDGHRGPRDSLEPGRLSSCQCQKS